MEPERSDQQWIRLLKKDDPEAVRDLWILLFRKSVIIAKRYRQSEDVGRDAAIEAYQRIRTRGVHQFRFNCPFPSFCRLVLVREVYRLIRLHEQALPTTKYDEETASETASEMEHHAPVGVAGALRAKLAPCLDQLKGRDREIIELRYFAEQDPDTIAARLGLVRNNVNQITYRARQALRQCLEQHGYQMAADLWG